MYGSIAHDDMESIASDKMACNMLRRAQPQPFIKYTILYYTIYILRHMYCMYCRPCIDVHRIVAMTRQAVFPL